MRFNSTAVTVILATLLVLSSATEVYAQSAASGSGALRPTFQALNQQRIDAARQKFQTDLVQFQSRIASREAEFKTRLDTFKDQNKAQIAERVNHNLNQINQNQTTLMTKNLETMTSILNQVVTKAGGTASGSAQVAAANSAISTAQTAVSAQALKDYTITVSTESAIQKDAQADRDKLHADLMTVRNLVVAAKQATITAVKGILNPVSSASPSATLKLGGQESSSTGLPVSQ